MGSNYKLPKYILNIFFFLFFPGLLINSAAQFKLRIEVTAPGTTVSDSIFIAGNFNNWSPANPDFKFKTSGSKYYFEKENLTPGTYEFKITKGSWNAVESTDQGFDINNRVIRLESDTTLSYSVAAWKNDFAAVEKKHTLSTNVSVADTAFYSPQLKRSKRIWVYIPPGYKGGTRKYPVIYMHDGQNLFDSYTAGFNEWGIDEILDSLIAAGKPASIIVGIDNGPQRLTEYNPYDNEKYGKGEGDNYVDFIIKNLKPYIEKKYRVLPGKENTTIAGSSMGGLISYYAALKYPSVFGHAGVFSPSFWIAPQIMGLTDSLAPKNKGMFYFYVGGLEGDEMTTTTNDIIFRLGSSSNALLYTVTDPEGLHNEAAWRKWFAEFYLWVNSNGLNHIVK